MGKWGASMHVRWWLYPLLHTVVTGTFFRFQLSGLEGNLRASTEGNFTIYVRKDWAPHAAKRFEELVRFGFFPGVRFHHVVKGVKAQFGVSGEAGKAKEWREVELKKDQVIEGNRRGTLAFATSGNSKGTEIYINLKDNLYLDKMGAATFAEVVGEGMKTVERLYAGYADSMPEPDRIESEGDAYLANNFPKLSVIQAIFEVAAPADLNTGEEYQYQQGPVHFTVFIMAAVLLGCGWTKIRRDMKVATRERRYLEVEAEQHKAEFAHLNFDPPPVGKPQGPVLGPLE